MLGVGKNTVEIIIAAKDRFTAPIVKAKAQMAGLQGRVGKLGGAVTKLSPALSGAVSTVRSFGAALGPLGIALAAAGVVMATLGGAAIKASLEFEKAFATIRVGTGATGDALGSLEDSFKTVFTSVPTSTADAATAIADLNTRLGLTGEPLEALATQFLNLSRITGTDVAASISSATRVMHDFAVSSEEQSGALDYLFKVSQSTGLGMTQLGNSMTQYGSVMRQMGFDINESAALLGKFEKEGVNLQLVLGSLRMGLANFAKAGEEPVEALQRVITEIQGMGSVADANMKAIEIFGSRAGPDMAAAIREGRFSIEELMDTLDASSETINQAAADTLTFGDKWKLAKNNIMEAIAPIGDVLTNVLGTAIESLSASFNMLQAVIGPVMSIFKTFFDAIDSAVTSALAPLAIKLKELQEKFKEGAEKLTLFSDIITIAAAGAKWLGEKIGVLLKRALTPLVEKLKEGIEMLTEFYNKLGPIKDAIDWVGTGIHNFAEGLREAEENTEELIEETEKAEEALKSLGEEGVEVPAKIKEATEEAAQEMKSFKVTIGDTTVEFKDAAAEVVKNAAAYKKLQDSAQTLIDLDWSVFTEFEASLPRIEAGLGDMESSFVGLKGILEVNIDKLENIQEAIIRINEIGAPFIDEGFLKGVDAIGKFAGALKTASDAIGDFSSLQDVSIEGCINFSLHVRDMVSALELLEGQMEDLVPSFGEMDSLITDIADAFLYSDDKVEGFIDNFDFAISRSKGILDSGAENFNEFREIVDKAMSAGELTFFGEQMLGDDKLIKEWKTVIVEGADDINRAMQHPYGRGLMSEFETTVGVITSGTDEIRDTYNDATMSLHNWVLENYGMMISQEELYAVMESPPEEQKKWLDDLMHSETALTFQMDKQTNALKDQTGQLAKITDALEPYLIFMRTLNELAALSTLSTDDLNSGLNSINDTLMNLGKSLETFDLQPVMESLFGAKIKEGEFAGGIATGFVDTMQDFATPFSSLIIYVERLTSSIFSLVSSFEALAKINDSVLADQEKLKEVFEGITKVMSNFSTEMGGTKGFAGKFAEGMVAMLTSAGPLITYFDKNNAAVIKFNNTLGTFKTTITHVVDVMAMLKRMSEMSLPSVTELEAGFERAEEAVLRFDEALLKHIGVGKESTNMDKNFNNVFRAIVKFAEDWSSIDEYLGDSFDTFEDGITTINDLINNIFSLVSAFESLADLIIPSSTAIEEAFVKTRDGVKAVTDALGSPIWADVSTNLSTFGIKWDSLSEGVEDSVTSFSKVNTIFVNIIGSTKQLSDTFTDMEKVVVITADQIEEAFKDMPDVISEVITYLTRDSFGVLKAGLKELMEAWEVHAEEMGKSMDSFNVTIDTFTTLISKVLSLSSALNELKDMSVLSVRDIDEALKKIPVFLDRFVNSLALNMGEIKRTLKDLNTEWELHADEMKDTMPAYEDATDKIGKLLSPILSLNSALKQLAEMGTISSTTFDKGFISLMGSISNFAISLSKNVDGLITALQSLRTVWVENEEVLYPLIYDFAIISDNLWGVAHNANRMSEEFKNISENAGTLEKGFKSLIGFIDQVVKSTKEFYTAEAAAELAGFITDVGKVIDAFVSLERELKGAMGKIKTAIGSAVDVIEGRISSIGTLTSVMYNSGANIMQSLINGIWSKSFALATAVAWQAAIIQAYLGVHSNTEKGPLSDIENWGGRIIGTVADGMNRGMPNLNAVFGSFSPSMGAGTGSGGSITLYNTQYINSREDADYSTNSIERMLQRHEVM